MIVGNFRIQVVCANKIEDGLYGDIYDDIEKCKKEHPTDDIIYGFYAQRIKNLSEEAAETPDWFYELSEVLDWCNSHE